MRAPLELTIFERHPGDGQPVYRVGGSFTPYAIVAKDKRFTDAELAAEFHKSTADFMSANSMHMLFEDAETENTLNDARDWMFATDHFATLPHYDEDTQ